jgi:Fe-Mn family superoxide dismutase
MTDTTRRNAMKTLAAGSAGLTLSSVLGIGNANAQDKPNPAPAFRGTRQPKPLPFDPAKLKGLSEKLVRSHHENNYTGAVTALNTVEWEEVNRRYAAAQRAAAALRG